MQNTLSTAVSRPVLLSVVVHYLTETVSSTSRFTRRGPENGQASEKRKSPSHTTWTMSLPTTAVPAKQLDHQNKQFEQHALPYLSDPVLQSLEKIAEVAND